MEIEDGIESGGVVLAHVAVGVGDGGGVKFGQVEAAHGEMHGVVQRFQRDNRRQRMVGVPLSRGRGVREHRVIRGVEAPFEPSGDLPQRGGHAVIDHGPLQPGDDVLVQQGDGAGLGELAGTPNEPGTFLGESQFDDPNTEFCFELGGWRDESGAHESNVDAGTNNRYADGAEVARQYNEDPGLHASKYWYHAEVFAADRLGALLATVRQPDLLSALRDEMRTMVDPILLCYYLFFPFHDQDGGTQECEDAPRDQLVGSCGGDWTCVAILLGRPDEGLDYAPRYIGLTGEQFSLDQNTYGAHHFDDDNRINLNVYRWKPDLTTDSHPRIHVAPGSHAMSMTPGGRVGFAFPDDALPTRCGEFDAPSLIPGRDDPSAWQVIAVVIAKIAAMSGIGLVAGVVELANALGESFPNPWLADPKPTEYPAAGAGLTIKPARLDVPGAVATADWRSQNGITLNDRRYDFVVDRKQQHWWPRDPERTNPNKHISRFRWGPRVTDDPLSRRAGMPFPDFWKMFFLGIADGKANKSFP